MPSGSLGSFNEQVAAMRDSITQLRQTFGGNKQNKFTFELACEQQ